MLKIFIQEKLIMLGGKAARDLRMLSKALLFLIFVCLSKIPDTEENLAIM